MSGHTPKPWMYDDDCVGVSDTPWDKEPFITSRICNMVGDHITTGENDANGVLIAAAPDMLEVLKEIERVFPVVVPGIDSFVEMAHKAIAKAEGKS